MKTKASNVVFVLRRKVPLCQSGGMVYTPRIVPFNVPINRITPGYCQVVFQFSIIFLQTELENENYLLQLNSLRVINGIVLHFTASQHFHKICTMRSVLDKFFFLTTYIISPYNFFSLLLIKKLGRGTATHPLKLIECHSPSIIIHLCVCPQY